MRLSFYLAGLLLVSATGKGYSELPRKGRKGLDRVSGFVLLTRSSFFQEVAVPNVDDLTTFSIDWYSDDGAIARRALAGEPITILQRDPFYDHWGTRRHVGDKGMAQFVDNWNHRLTRGIRRQHVAINQEHDGPAIGWYTEILAGQEGVAARMAWNRNGRRLLEQGGYAYFSPAVAWRMRDKETNEWVYNQIAGGGVTNDPYLGETTALMRRGFSYRKGGFLMSDNQKPQAPDELNLILRGAMRLFSALGQPVTFEGATPAGEGATASPPADVSELTQQVAELRQQVEQATGSISTLTTQRDTALEQAATLAGRVSTVEQNRLVERFRGMVASQFSHLPGTTDQLADELLWLFTRDAPANGDAADATRPHYAFFSELLTRASKQYQSAFSSRGSLTAPEGSVFEQVQSLIAKYTKDHEGVSADEAQSAVFASNPQLYGQYLLELDNEEARQ